MYTYNKKILFSDIDSSARLSVGKMLDVMQDCVNINSESIGRGIEYMMEKKRTWFAIGWNIEIQRFPKMFEDVVVKTWPYSFSTSIGYRNIVITDTDGKDIVCADSMWTLMDMETGRPTKICDEDCRGYELEEKYPMESLGRKIKLPADFKDVETIVVRKSDVDYNGHMSNGKYIQIADEYLPSGIEIKRIRVEYKNQSRYNERLRILLSKQDGIYVVMFVGESDDSVKAVVEFLVK